MQELKYDLLIKQGHVVDPVNMVDQVMDVGIKDGKIAAVASDLELSDAENTLWSEGLLVMPGIVDSHAHVARPKAFGAGYRMLVKAGVTTAVDFEGPMEVVIDEIMTYGCGLNVAVLEGLWPGVGLSSEHASRQEAMEQVQRALDKGSLGVKLLGGHYPLTPETIANVIEAAAESGAYVAFHVGSTKTGSNILGLEEAIQLASGHPLHIAHVNSYCRGLIDEPLVEIGRALSILKQAQNLVSESHLAPLNGCSGRIGENGLPASHVTRNCLKALGYPINEAGLRQALLDGRAAVYSLVGRTMQHIWKEEAYRCWLAEDTQVGVSFPANLRSAALICATEKHDSGEFVVDAISSDGGAIPRNVILSHGLALVQFGALTLSELVLKLAYNPACMFGFTNKGHLTVGADADVIVVHPCTGRVHATVIAGQFSALEGIPLTRPGHILTTERGVKVLRQSKVNYRVVDLRDSTFFNRGARTVD